MQKNRGLLDTIHSIYALNLREETTTLRFPAMSDAGSDVSEALKFIFKKFW
jgi:hypothetical protein